MVLGTPGLALLVVLAVHGAAFAQLPPTGSHYAGRPSDTGHRSVSGTGGYATSIALDLPPARGGIAVPVAVAYGRRGLGAAGLGWDVPLSFVRRDATVARRRPAYAPGGQVQGREQIVVSLGGRTVHMVQSGSVWLARQDAPDLELHGEGNTWRLLDGAGRELTFTAPAGLVGSDFWLLSSITTTTRVDRIDLEYEVTPHFFAGGSGIAIDLVAVRYNTHPSTPSCTKHEVRLDYNDTATEPLSLSLLYDLPIVRMRTLREIRVRARESCAGSLVTLRRYQLAYASDDPDTQLPRLSSVRMFGREGTPEASTSVPVATYGYGAATTNGTLVYQRGTDIAIPSDCCPGSGGTPPIARTHHDTNASSPDGGKTYVNWQNLVDISGDGRPDLIYEQNGELRVAMNRPAAGSATTLTSTASVPLGSPVYNGRPLASHASKTIRYDYEWQNQDHVWRQLIDANGDGRLDIIDAAEEPGVWAVYLNTPGNPVTWVKRRFRVNSLRTILKNRGHVIDGDYVPLARRTTGFDLRVRECWKWDQSAQPPQYVEVPYPLSLFDVGCNGSGSGSQDKASTEKSYTEWEVRDVNGDGYPDVVFNSSPVRNVDQPVCDDPGDPFGGVYCTFQSEYIHVELVDDLRPTAGAYNAIEVVLDTVGVRFDDHDPFSTPLSLDDNTSCGIALWQASECEFCGPNSVQTEQQYQICGVEDVNGDGIADRIDRGIVHLGSGDSFANPQVTIQLPGPARQLNPHDNECATGNPLAPFDPKQIAGLRDLTGDGIPDFIEQVDAGWQVSIGTGTKFLPPVPIDIPTTKGFSISNTTENCAAGYAHTMGGLYDVDGDGKPEVVHILHNPTHLEVYHLAGEVAGNPQAGRLTTIDNGYGAVTTIAYRSAKEDASRGHQVPFPEIVVTSVETTGALGLGGTLSAVHYAYGDAEQFFDPVLDTFTMRAYGRTVEVYGTGREAGEADIGIVRETNLLPPFVSTMTDAERFERYQKVGRVRETHVLGHGVPRDPWALLASFDPVVDSRRMAGQSDGWTSRYVPLAQCANTSVDTADVMYPYDWSLTFSSNIGHSPCADRGFGYMRSSTSWLGTQPPGPSASNVQTRREVLGVDDFGNVLSAKNENDRFRSDDDLCVETTYATPTAQTRNLHAPATRRVTDCLPERTFWVDSWEYDALAIGSVALGRVTSHTFERRATNNGQLLGTPIREYEAGHDGVGNVDYLVSAREDGVVRSLQISHDDFGLVPVVSTVDATALAPLELRTDRDPVSLDVTSRRDANGTSWGTEVDGFGRVVRSTVTPPGGTLGVGATIRYDGFAGGDPSGRTIWTKEFSDPVAPAAVDTTFGQEAFTRLDELGRAWRAEQLLGADYTYEKLVVLSRVFDGLGRVSFEADPHPASQDSATAYGTTYHFATDGTLTCSIRGHGPQALTSTSDIAAERFPTCFTRTFSNNTLRVSVSKPDALLAGSPQAGVTYVDTMTAIGRVLERETLKNATRYELARFEHDQLGQLVALTRYRNPDSNAEPVRWSWRLDGAGQTLEAEEPENAKRFFSYSNWGELLAVDWTDSALSQTLQVARFYDGFGRITDSVEKRDGAVVPETVFGWQYDTGTFQPSTFGAGRLTETTSPIGAMHLSYDAFGRVAVRTFLDEVGERVGIETSQHHLDGTLSTLDFQVSDTGLAFERYQYSYDSASRLKTVTFDQPKADISLFAASTIDPWGRVRSAMYGDNTAYAGDYADTGRRLPIKHAITLPGPAVRSIEYRGYDAIGRELGRREDLGGSVTATSNQYDTLGRLTRSARVTGPTLNFDTAFAFDPLGNVTLLIDAVSGEQANLTFASADLDRVCRIVHGPPSSGPCNVRYDRSGNITAQPTRSGSVRALSYYPSGAVEAIAQGATTARFSYDGSGEISALDVEGGFDRRRDRRFGPFERREINGQSIIVRHVPGPGGIVASRRGANGPWIFPFADDRGLRFATDGSAAVQDVTYMPFGVASSTGAQPGSLAYTKDQWNGGDALADLGIVHLGARLYDPVIGRFLSRDPLIVPRTAATTNPYAFALNDPINLSDPFGLDPLAVQQNSTPDPGGGAPAVLVIPDPSQIGAFVSGLLSGSDSKPGPKRLSQRDYAPSGIDLVIPMLDPYSEGFNGIFELDVAAGALDGTLDSLLLRGVAPGVASAFVDASTPTPGRTYLKPTNELAYNAGFIGGGFIAGAVAELAAVATQRLVRGGLSLYRAATAARLGPAGSIGGRSSVGTAMTAQLTPNACGPACGSQLLRESGLDVFQSNLTRGWYKGMTPESLAANMSRFQPGWRGFYAYPTAKQLAGLSLRGPFIARTGGNPGHFVIVDRVSGGSVYIRDPANGLASSEALSDFVSIVSGVVYR